MTDSILPIDVQDVVDVVDVEAPEPERIEKEVQPHDVEEEVVEETTPRIRIKQEEIFVKETSEKHKKKRKPMSDAQKEKLAIAREKSLARRRALKEAKDLEKATLQIERKQKIDAKVAKKMEQDSVMEMKARIYKEAQSKATWDEDRLVNLMTKTIDNYIETKKKQKPVPRQHIPHPNQYPHLPPQHQPQPQNYYGQPQHQQSGPQQPQQPHQQSGGHQAYNSLFGFGGV
jgi:hypothetical protein